MKYYSNTDRIRVKANAFRNSYSNTERLKIENAAAKDLDKSLKEVLYWRKVAIDSYNESITREVLAETKRETLVVYFSLDAIARELYSSMNEKQRIAFDSDSKNVKLMSCILESKYDEEARDHFLHLTIDRPPKEISFFDMEVIGPWVDFLIYI